MQTHLQAYRTQEAPQGVPHVAVVVDDDDSGWESTLHAAAPRAMPIDERIFSKLSEKYSVAFRDRAPYTV